jgi:AraC family transcriptional regulator of adaptative response/methylated-DNA-[protein]-cysteine methyltransferase
MSTRKGHFLLNCSLSTHRNGSMSCVAGAGPHCNRRQQGSHSVGAITVDAVATIFRATTACLRKIAVATLCEKLVFKKSGFESKNRSFFIMEPNMVFLRTSTNMKTSSTSGQGRYADDEERWQAVLRKDHQADGKFVHAVKTTGVYCRPSCPARSAHRGNVVFYNSPEEAERASFRACKRCKPQGSPRAELHAATVAAACRAIETAEKSLDLNALASAAGMSRFHFHRIFKAATGLTPKAYAAACRSSRMREVLSKSSTVTEAIYEAGFNSNGRFYAKSSEMLGMKPKSFRGGGRGSTIRFAIGECSLGSILVAASEKGVCAILLGDNPETLAMDFQNRFPQANLVGDDRDFENLVARVVGLIEAPKTGLDLPLDVQGTAFQQRVWQALREIPAGSTSSYSKIAERIGYPRAVRAVARACASNAIAVAIPCHRVLRNDGTLSGYRWGVERKRAMLDREGAVL